MLITISDLHWGAGDALDDFLWWGGNPNGPAPSERAAALERQDTLFAMFLETKMAAAKSAGLRPTLLLLGDTFDFWQVQRRREPPTEALERILTAHVHAFSALRTWMGDGGRIELVVGNHDQPLVDANAWAVLAELLPGINARSNGQPAHYFSDEATGLYAEHGHRWDPHNRIRHLGNPDSSCQGYWIVRHIVNELEPTMPWIDKTTDGIGNIIRVAQMVMTPDARRRAFRGLARALRGPSFIKRVLDPWKDGRSADWRELANRELAMMNNGIERATMPRPGGTTGPLPMNFRYFASGHTHEALRVQTRHAVERFNTGTWRPLLTGTGQHLRMIQPLHYAQLIPDGAGDWELSLRSWAEEAKISSSTPTGIKDEG